MRICLYTVTALPKLGGQEAVVDALARHLQAMGHEPVVLAPQPRRPLRPRDADLPYPMLRHPRFVSTRHGVGFYRRWLLDAHHRRRFDLVHCHDVYPCGFVAALANQQMGVPLVITSHGGDIRQGNVRLAKPGLRKRFELAIQSAAALISIGPFTREALLRLGAKADQIQTIPNGVDAARLERPVDRPAGLDERIVPGRYLLFLGRLAPRKGVDVLLSAMQLLAGGAGTEAEAGTPPVGLVIAGAGDEEPAIRQRIEAAGLGRRIWLVGRVAGPAKAYLLQNAIATVMPSRQWEAFPLVVLESYAAGRPVIGTAIPGLSDVIQHERTGLLVPPEDPAALAAAIKRLAQEPNLANDLGRTAAATAADYDWTAITRRHVELYQRLASAARASG